jgi:hypothetical protein
VDLISFGRISFWHSDLLFYISVFAVEPQIQKKKRVVIDYEPLKITDGYVEPPSDRDQKSRSSTEIEAQATKVLKKVQNDEYILLGPQDKLSSNNIPYALRKPFVQYKNETKPQASAKVAENHSENARIVENQNSKMSETVVIKPVCIVFF